MLVRGRAHTFDETFSECVREQRGAFTAASDLLAGAFAAGPKLRCEVRSLSTSVVQGEGRDDDRLSGGHNLEAPAELGGPRGVSYATFSCHRVL